MAFVTRTIETRKSTSANAIQVKNRHKTNRTDEKLDVISRLEKLNELFHTLIVACIVHFVIILTELKKLLNQEMKYLCSKTTTALSE